jgi:SLAP domain-containing protein
MKKVLIPLLAITAGAFLFTGCAREGAYAPVNTTRFDIENRERFVLLDKPTQNSVTVSLIQMRPHEDGRLEVAANVRNRLNRRIQVQINCEFKDQFGVAVDSTPFETLILGENEQRTVRYISMNDRAKDFTMRVRQAR